MGGFLGGLGTLLGGFNTARRIDEEGFDFREKQAQEEFLRQREQEKARQEDEDRAANIGAEILLGAPEGETPDLAQFMPDVNRERAMARAFGKYRTTKPVMEAQRASTQLMLKQLGGMQTARNIMLQGTNAQDLARLRANLEAGMPESPAEKARRESLERMNSERVAAMRYQSEREGRPMPFDITEGSATVRRWASPEYLAEHFGPESGGARRLGTTEANRIAAAQKSLIAGENILQELARPEFAAAVGPIIGRGQTLARMAGMGDPIATNLAGAIYGLAALQPQIHGFRAYQFAKDLESRLLTQEQTPESLAAGIQGLLAVSRAVAGQEIPPFDVSSVQGLGEGANTGNPEVDAILAALAGSQ